MSSPKFEITNPEAIKLINDIKGGIFFAPVKTWLTRYKWYLVSGFVVTVLLIFLAVGKTISSRKQVPVYLPPDLSTPSPTTSQTVKSDYEWIRQNLINFSTDLPDPVIPPFNNSINLEGVNI